MAFVPEPGRKRVFRENLLKFQSYFYPTDSEKKHIFLLFFPPMFIRKSWRGNLLSLTRPQLALCHHFLFLCFLFYFTDEKGQKVAGKKKRI